MLIYDEQYYQNVIKDYGYAHFELDPINFNLQNLSQEVLKSKWLCHIDGNKFANSLHQGDNCIVTTGFGLSGAPHIGTISQMLCAVMLQKAGLNVQIVLGDLDAYNARNQSLADVKDRAERYSIFLSNLGFDSSRGIIRNQIDHPNILLTAFLSANCLTDRDFARTEEDISELYIQMNIYPGIEFSVKQSILLMIADFIDLGNEYKNVLVMLGLDEHKYTQLARTIIERQKLNFSIAGMYSRLNKGFNNYPKMSKSIPGSAITVETPEKQIINLILNCEGEYQNPLDSVVYQMMCSASFYSIQELNSLYTICAERKDDWRKAKLEYADVIIDICKKW